MAVKNNSGKNLINSISGSFNVDSCGSCGSWHNGNGSCGGKKSQVRQLDTSLSLHFDTIS
jgi:hypothetical protein